MTSSATVTSTSDASEKTRIFLSHITGEEPVAKAIKDNLERALKGVEVFVAGQDIRVGDKWLEIINEALSSAQAVIVLCSRRSIERPWVNFECGGGWSRDLSVIPVCHRGLRRDELPFPLQLFQGLNLDSADACRELASSLSQKLKVTIKRGFDFAAMARSFERLTPERTKTIGIILTHGQEEWDLGMPSVFRLPDTLPRCMENRWIFDLIRDTEKLLSVELDTLPGLILGNPKKSRMKPEVVSALVDWVYAGGRLLLLGYELGDRHHEGNLSDLARHFGIHPLADIVGPPNYGPKKPYGPKAVVEYAMSCADPHSFTTDLSTICLTNAQTMYVEPVGTEWLRVGRNVVYRPDPTTVVYNKGTMTQPNQAFTLNEKAGWLPVAVQAPPGLCGKGMVHAIGTWRLLGPDGECSNDNRILLERLLDWLSGTE